MHKEIFTPSGVRLRQRVQRAGDLNWLFLPGGPGIGSESLHELVDALDVPGTSWLVDLPGDGSNRDLPIPPEGHYQKWPDVLLEAVQTLPNSIYVGHSTGGMYLLSVPELEKHIKGLVLISTAPDASWHPRFVQMTMEHPLPAVEAATRAFEEEKSRERLRDLAVASAEWNFRPETLDIGRELLARMPYCFEAVEWSDVCFDHVYAAQWWPTSLPTLILSGADDRIVFQGLWEDPKFQGKNVIHQTIARAAHFLWIEQSEAVRSAFRELAARIQR
jgi:pimeloyl-ACP methyl ester carboxylesterase